MDKAASSAKAIQAAREAADLEMHRSRVEWLTEADPKWSDGTPVSSSDRHDLLSKSRAAIAQEGGAA